MKNLTGVYQSTKKDGRIYYRSSITFNNKHLSLGSYSTELTAHEAYLLAYNILFKEAFHYLDFKKRAPLSFDKWFVLLNYRDNGYYIKNPIYLHKTYFSYFLDEQTELKFDVDDLFYYSNHKIFSKSGYLFVNDYGMQVNILNRYGIKNHAVVHRDYQFIDGDSTNLTRQNLLVLNPYHGVELKENGHHIKYVARINIKGRYTIGWYKNQIDAAIAYNKAAEVIMAKDPNGKTYALNYINQLSKEDYKLKYHQLIISKKIINYNPNRE